MLDFYMIMLLNNRVNYLFVHINNSMMEDGTDQQNEIHENSGFLVTYTGSSSPINVDELVSFEVWLYQWFQETLK